MGPTMIKNANNTNVARMRQEDQSSPTTTTTPPPLLEEETTEEDLIWEALADCQIRISMQKLLDSVSRFWRSPHRG